MCCAMLFCDHPINCFLIPILLFFVILQEHQGDTIQDVEKKTAVAALNQNGLDFWAACFGSGHRRPGSTPPSGGGGAVDPDDDDGYLDDEELSRTSRRSQRLKKKPKKRNSNRRNKSPSQLHSSM